MVRFLLARLLQGLVTLAGVCVIVFFALRLTGDPAALLAPEGASLAEIATLRQQLGYDRPLIVQFGAYLDDLRRLDFGISAVQRQPVAAIVVERLPASLLLSGAAFAGAILCGTMLGLLAVWRPRSIPAWLAQGGILMGQSMPTFLSGTILILIFAVVLGWLPSSGAAGRSALVLPAVALGAYSAALIARMTVATLSEELGRSYCRAARARGLGAGRILIHHALRNAAPTLLAVAALEAGNLFAGTIIVETVFAWPGIGQLLLQSVQSRDLLVTQAIVLVVAAVYIAANLAADLIEAATNPHLGRRIHG